MNETTTDPLQTWDSIAPVIDEVLATLSARDREVLLLRFFEGLPLAELGTALELSPDAARMRVERALERTHALLLKKGVTSTAAALAGALGTQAALATPGGLAATISASALSSAASGSAATIFFMTISKTKLAVLAVLIAGGAATIVVQQKNEAALERALTETRRQNSLEKEDVERLRIAAERAGAAKSSAMSSSVESAKNAAPGSSRRDETPTPSESVARTPENSSTTPLLAEMTPIKKLSDVGQGSARAAFATQLWAAHGGDVEREAKAIVVSPKAREKLDDLIPSLPEEIRAHYKTPEELMAYVLSGSPRPLSAAQVISETQRDADTVIVRAAWQHEGSSETITNDVPFHRGPEGWQMVIGPSLVDRAVSYLTNRPIPPPKGTGK